jgi:hypothetical protein
MKKLTIILVVMLSMVLLLSGAAFALQSITTTAKTVGSAVSTTFTPSTNVTIYFDSPAAQKGITYASGANHNKGSKTYASTSTNSSIYWLGNTAAPSTLAAPSTVGNGSAPTGFTTAL